MGFLRAEAHLLCAVVRKDIQVCQNVFLESSKHIWPVTYKTDIYCMPELQTKAGVPKRYGVNPGTIWSDWIMLG